MLKLSALDGLGTVLGSAPGAMICTERSVEARWADFVVFKGQPDEFDTTDPYGHRVIKEASRMSRNGAPHVEH